MPPRKFASIVSSVMNRLQSPNSTFKDVVEEEVKAARIRARMAAILPLPKTLSDQIPQELFEQFIFYLSKDRRSLAACSTVCRAWFAVGRRYLFARLPIRPIFLRFGHEQVINTSVALREYSHYIVEST